MNIPATTEQVAEMKANLTTVRAGHPVAVFGHYPPPITGERLCCLYLIDRLTVMGLKVSALTKKDGLRAHCAAQTAWMILGSETPGFLRDCLITVRQSHLKRLFIYIHNGSWRRMEKYHRVLRPLMGSKVRLVVLTEHIAQRLAAVGWSVDVLRNTVTSSDLLVVRGDPTKYRMIWMAAITEEKGFFEAYEAFKILRGRNAAWTFEVYGRGVDATQFPFANFHGVVAGAEKCNAFGEGGILVLPSRYQNETQPLCLLEAMAAGLPVVASAIGGIPEIIGAGETAAGYCLVNCEPALLAEKIEDARSHGVTLGCGAKTRFKQLFSPDAFDVRLREILSIPSEWAS